MPDFDSKGNRKKIEEAKRKGERAGNFVGTGIGAGVLAGEGVNQAINRAGLAKYKRNSAPRYKDFFDKNKKTIIREATKKHRGKYMIGGALLGLGARKAYEKLTEKKAGVLPMERTYGLEKVANKYGKYKKLLDRADEALKATQSGKPKSNVLKFPDKGLGKKTPGVPKGGGDVHNLSTGKKLSASEVQNLATGKGKKEFQKGFEQRVQRKKYKQQIHGAFKKRKSGLATGARIGAAGVVGTGLYAAGSSKPRAYQDKK